MKYSHLKHLWQRIRVALSGFYLPKYIALILPVLVIWPSPVMAQPCATGCAVNVTGSHAPLLLLEMAEQLGVEIVFEGELLDPVSIQFRSQSADQFVRNVAEVGGYLVAQRGRKYTLYGRNVEEVTIALTPKHLSAEEGSRHLNRLERVEVLVLEDANAIILRGSSNDVRLAADLLRAIDIVLPNVFLELLVVEYYHDDSFVWAYDILDGTKGKAADVSIVPGAGTITGNYESLTDLPKAFRFNLTSLVQDSDARVVTNPHIAVRSGQPGRIELREQLNIVLSNETENFGITRTLQRLEAGVMLNVIPDVLDGNFVDLQVQGEVSVFVTAPQGQFAIDIQSVETRVLVESGKTLVIGGLVAKQSSVTNSGVPLLRKIPLLGYLFKSKTQADRLVETVIYITPYINDPSFFNPDNIGADVDEFFDKP